MNDCTYKIVLFPGFQFDCERKQSACVNWESDRGSREEERRVEMLEQEEVDLANLRPRLLRCARGKQDNQRPRQMEIAR